jgi:hypothetical protein
MNDEKRLQEFQIFNYSITLIVNIITGSFKI